MENKYRIREDISYTGGKHYAIEAYSSRYGWTESPYAKPKTLEEARSILWHFKNKTKSETNYYYE